MYNIKNIGKIAILAGGLSSEKDISIKSGRAVYDALKLENCDVEWLEIGTGDIEKALKQAPFDIAFIALHGRFGEDGTVQNILERMSIPYTGSGVKASQLALDKIASRKIFKKRRIPVPKYQVLRKETARNLKTISYPLVVKPQREGSSIGLSIAKNSKEFDRACKKAFKYGDKVIVEEYIKGREITVGILDNKPLPVVEIIPKRVFYDFNAKYNDDRTEYKVPASLPLRLYKKAQTLGLAAHNAIHCSDFSRVDMLLDQNGNISILEVNSIPGLTQRSLLPKAASAIGIDFSKLCIKLLQLALKNRYNKV